MKKNFLLAMILVFCVSILVAEELHVGPGQQYSTIQSAINDAYDGDIITVHEGEYVENLVIENKSLTLRNENWESGNWNPENFIINGDYNGHVIEIISGDYVIIQGFTIKNSGTNIIVNPGNHQNVYDSGIFSYSTDILTIQYNIFTNNFCGIYMKIIGIQAEISSNTFDDLISEWFSKYIFWHGYEYLSADLIIEDNYFYKIIPLCLNGLIDCWYCNIEILNNEFSIYRASVIDIRFTSLVTINNNNFFLSDEGDVILTTHTDLIMNYNNIIYEEDSIGNAVGCFSTGVAYKTGYFTENLIIGGTKGFWFDVCVSPYPPGNFHGFFKNNTVSLCETAIHIENNSQLGSENNILEFKNNIIWNVDTAFDIERELIIPINIEFSCIEGGVPVDPSIVNGEGNIDDDPLFTTDYHLTENSPCIDAGDPDTDGDGDDWIIDPDDRDPDGSRKDMGCYYFDHPYDTHCFSSGVTWVSFPKLTEQGTYPQFNGEIFEQAYDENDLPGLLQDPVTGGLSITDFDIMYGNRILEAYIDYIPLTSAFEDYGFDNMLFRHEGYKIEVLPEAEPTALVVDGDRLLVDHEISGSMEPGEYHWLGYWLFRTQKMVEAFGDYWQYVIKVKSEDWFYYPLNNIRGGDPTTPVALSAENLTLEYGKAYLIWFDEEVENFHWTDSSITEEPREKAKPESFTYTEKADYEAIDVFNIPPDIIEIGVFEDEVCVGAVVVEDTCAQILVYSDYTNRDPVPFTFEVVTGRGQSTPIKNYQVLDWETGEFESRSIISGRQEYSVIRFGDEDESENNIFSTPQLYGNYPNPFNPTTSISFSLPKEDDIELTIYNIKGQKVKTLYSGIAEEGKHTMIWEGKNTNDKSVSSGIYFYKLKTGKNEISRKMLLLK
jgi:flagellar hook assembly protein FlgD